MEENEAGCITTTGSYEVTVEECTFVEELSTDILKIYPNPVNANLNVNIFAGYSSEIIVSIYTISGKTMLENEVLQGPDQTNYSIDVSHLPPGMYLLKVNDAEGSLITGKFIKN